MPTRKGNSLNDVGGYSIARVTIHVHVADQCERLSFSCRLLSDGFKSLPAAQSVKDGKGEGVTSREKTEEEKEFEEQRKAVIKAAMETKAVNTANKNAKVFINFEFMQFIFPTVHDQETKSALE